MRTVELTCDDRLDGRVRDAWRRLDAAGVPSLARHTHPTNRPHLTVASADDLPPDSWVAIDAALAVLPLPVALDGVLFFAGRTGVLAWRVVPDDALLALHGRVWRALATATGRNPLHEPGRWTPHVSLARRVTAAQHAAALAALDGRLTAVGTFTAARSYDTATRTVTPLAGRPPPG